MTPMQTGQQGSAEQQTPAALAVTLHPEAVPGRADTVRWVIPEGLLPCGVVTLAPGALGELMRAGTITGAVVECAAVWLTMGQPHSWARQGAAVRAALADALTTPDEWEISREIDDVLTLVGTDVLAGSLGDYIRSHGGEIVLRDVRDGVLQVSMHGACAHCPAAGVTLQARLESAIRARCPDLVELREEPSGQVQPGPLRWLRAMPRS